MKAMVHHKFGPPEVLRLEDVAKPEPGENDLLIRIYATTVAIEEPEMRAKPGFNGILKPRHSIPGMYLAGKVEAMGKNVQRFAKGDDIYGSAGLRMGTAAEYICLPATAALAKMPGNMSYAEAAAIPNGGLTALPFFRDKGGIKSGQKVLINGASGAVGTTAVQLAKHFGTTVTGSCSTANIDLVKSLGADRVVDYTKADITENGERFDIIFDVAGKIPFSNGRRILTENGIYMTTVPTPATPLQILWTKLFGKKKVRFAATALRKSYKQAADLATLAGIIEEGQLKAVIDRRYRLEELAEAHRYVETGRKRGNVVVTID